VEVSDLSEAISMVNLSFADWFRPFSEDDPVHPYLEDTPPDETDEEEPDEDS
jgi:hypothetical protein